MLGLNPFVVRNYCNLKISIFSLVWWVARLTMIMLLLSSGLQSAVCQYYHYKGSSPSHCPPVISLFAMRFNNSTLIFWTIYPLLYRQSICLVCVCCGSCERTLAVLTFLARSSPLSLITESAVMSSTTTFESQLKVGYCSWSLRLAVKHPRIL